MFNTLRDYKKIVVYIVVIAFIAGSGLMGYGALFTDQGGETPEYDEQAQNFIATVNGEGIGYREFSNFVNQQVQQVRMQQQELSSAQYTELRYNVLNHLIESRLRLQEAMDIGLIPDVGEEDIDQYIEEHILEAEDMTEEELKSLIQQQHDIDMEQFREILKGDLEQQNLVEQRQAMIKEGVEVTEEELEEEFETRYGDEETEQEFADVKDELQQDLLGRKEDEALREWMEDLKEDAELEIRDTELRGMYKLNEGNYQEAIVSLSEAKSSTPSAGIYIHLADVYHRDEQIEEAKNVYQEAVDQDFDSWEIRLNYGQLLTQIEEGEGAIEQLDKAAEMADEDNFMAQYQLYMAYSQAGAEEKAEEKMQQIQQLQMEMQQQMQQPAPETEEDTEQEEIEVEIDQEDLEEEFDQ